MLKKYEIDLNDIKEGDVVQYENKYHFAGVVKILEDKSDEKHHKFEVKILDKIFGNLEEGENFTFGKIKDSDGYEYLIKWKVKEVGSPTEYSNGEFSLDKLEKKTQDLRTKYQNKRHVLNKT